jgi:hypothetical protein
MVTVNAAGRHRQECHGTGRPRHDRETAAPFELRPLDGLRRRSQPEWMLPY